jgi:hypothetical protein
MATDNHDPPQYRLYRGFNFSTAPQFYVVAEGLDQGNHSDGSRIRGSADMAASLPLGSRPQLQCAPGRTSPWANVVFSQRSIRW